MVDPKKGTAISDDTCVHSEKKKKRPREIVFSLCCVKAGRRCQVPRCPSLSAGSGGGCCRCEGLARGWGGQQEPFHPPLTPSLLFAFILWLPLCCLPHPRQRLPDSILYVAVAEYTASKNTNLGHVKSRQDCP